MYCPFTIGRRIALLYLSCNVQQVWKWREHLWDRKSMRSQGDRCPRLLHPTKRAMSYSWTEWGATLHSADCICVHDSPRDRQSNVLNGQSLSTKWNVHYFGFLVEGTVVWKGWVSSNPSAKLFIASPSLRFVNTVRIDELVRYYVLKENSYMYFQNTIHSCWNGIWKISCSLFGNIRTQRSLCDLCIDS